ncbi:hypothetical protein DDB_G0276513 [Dictyostelium discoideum AX4]|uniref:Uncharacterized protein n=1 Tax=Dictyostelium discoideum TaxID=44689 RepID=Q551I0_DICDI|nr:hypothetical protein DDB_G0276513 [Dictyostelium discoideum AX4]EAL69210.1 hypothetical protein DDB_G0276513 [Dictyostelium discoideum AX4]|eukprot:XP_643154.1 hypothetical protein DDB_G0276513 [Dictyostelium discoideum AX4]
MDGENNNGFIKKVSGKVVQFSKEHPVIASTLVIGGVCFGGAPLLVSYVGFTSGGIAAGSAAASIASALGSGSAIVATAQSIGATGTLLVASKTSVIAAISSCVGGNIVGKKIEKKFDVPK